MENRGGLKQRLTALVLFGLSLVYFGFAFSLKIGSLRSPGPGFFPLIVGSALVVLTLAYLIRTVLANSKDEAESALKVICRIAEGTEELRVASGDEFCGESTVGETFHPSEVTGKKTRLSSRVIAVSLCTFAYPLVIVHLKFVTATFLVSLGMLLAFRPKKIVFSALLSIALAIGSFFFFGRFFGVPLPSGSIEVLLYRVGG